MCELTAGHTKQNCASIGGVKSVLVYNMENRATFVVTAGVVTAITMETGKQAWRIKPDTASIEMTETGTRSRENNTLFYAQAGTVMIKDDVAETRILLDLLAKGFLGLIIEKEDGTNIHYGAINGVVAPTVEDVTGKNFEDLNGATISFEGKEATKSPTVDDAEILTLLSPAV